MSAMAPLNRKDLSLCATDGQCGTTHLVPLGPKNSMENDSITQNPLWYNPLDTLDFAGSTHTLAGLKGLAVTSLEANLCKK